MDSHPTDPVDAAVEAIQQRQDATRSVLEAEKVAATVMRSAPHLHLRVYGHLHRHGSDALWLVNFAALTLTFAFWVAAEVRPDLADRRVAFLLAVGMLAAQVVFHLAPNPAKPVLTAARAGYDEQTLRAALARSVETGIPLSRIADELLRNHEADESTGDPR